MGRQKWFLLLLCLLSSCAGTGEASAARRAGKRESAGSAAQASAAKSEEEPVSSQNYKFVTPLERSEEDKVIVRVEAFHTELDRAFSPRARQRKLATVEILQDKTAFQARVTRDKPEVLEQDSALYVKDRVILVHLGLDSGNLFRTIFRNQTRLYLYDLTRNFPLWIEEGLVSFFEEVTVSENRYIITGYSADKMSELQALLKSGNYPGFKELVQITQRKDFTESHRLISWGFTYWAQVGSDANRTVYNNYLRAVMEKGADNVNIEDFLNMSLEEFQKKWQNWILKKQIYKKGDDK